MSRTQFSLRTLLAAIAAVGIGAALWTAEPSPAEPQEMTEWRIRD